MKCPLEYVGRVTNPEFFRYKESVQHYTHNKKTWFDKGVTHCWFRDVFAPFFEEKFSIGDAIEAHCIVIIDVCSAHVGIQDWLDENGIGQIHIITLPPNVTYIFQPMDQGIITCLKRLYSYELVVDIIEIYTDPDIMDAEVSSIKPG